MLYETATTDRLLDAIDARPLPADHVAVILLGEKAPADIPALISALNSRDIPFIGGIFPAVISGESCSETGAIIMQLPSHRRPFLLTEAEECADAVPGALSEEGGGGTALVFVDGLSEAVPSLLTQCLNRFGATFSFIGAGAGSLSRKRGPAVFCGEGFFRDAAVVALIDLECRLSIRHGWKRIGTPLVATRTVGNTILELNWEPALEVYREVVRKHSGKTITADNFFAIARGHPFGIYSEGGEDIVRDPIALTNEGGLVCVGNIPENAVLHILTGSPEALTEAAGEAASAALRYDGDAIRTVLVIDCISRMLYLGDAFADELAAVGHNVEKRDPALIMEGILSIGEISSGNAGILHFFNKTIVVGALLDRRNKD
ncbi:MAG: FIST C-terminal domain-containing protein [Methanomicrobiaceae archaeon]|nr:FIST C-terminal domain-containing protein [Methanomicrobiaceae archaeon]